MIRNRNGRFEVRVWMRLPDGTRRKQSLGTFTTLEQAEVAQGWKRLDLGARRCTVCLRRFVPLWEAQERCSPDCEKPKPKRQSRQGWSRANEHWVYICCNEAGEVLYVGVTGAQLRRFQEHARMARWWSEITTIRIEHFIKAEAAFERERALIAELQPPQNVLNGSYLGRTNGEALS